LAAITLFERYDLQEKIKIKFLGVRKPPVLFYNALAIKQAKKFIMCKFPLEVPFTFTIVAFAPR